MGVGPHIKVSAVNGLHALEFNPQPVQHFGYGVQAIGAPVEIDDKGVQL